MQNPFDHFFAEPTAHLSLHLDEETSAALDALCADTSHTREQIMIALIWYAYQQ
ncbi:hypothetical protein [Aquabacter cavernae]|uniref:hypothetical protein n=1 Tax=Aquabacter cavernae TaxID=2496029 RepID=UPI0013DEA35C|nr:hypothetical protein [Aquabacter cavernae]